MDRARAAAAAGIVSRIGAAIVGGFAASSALVIALPALLPGSKAQWVTGFSMLGFALWTGTTIWVFAARTATRAWAGLVVVTAIAAVLTWVWGGAPA